MSDFDERVAFFRAIAEAKGYSQEQVDFLMDCAEWASDYQWGEIRKGLESGVDVSIYADPKFYYDQMSAIRRGLEHKIDVSTYADPRLSGDQMEQIRNELKAKKN